MSGTELSIVVAAVLAGALVKSVTGLGLPLVAIPVISLVTSVETAVALLAIPNTAQNLTLVVRHRGARTETAHLRRFCGLGVIGAVFGTWSLGAVPETALLVALVTIVTGYLALTVLAPSFRIDVAGARRWSAPIGLSAGVFQGAVGISGPIVATWHHGLRLSREAFVFSVATVFLLTGATQTAVLAARGSLDGHYLTSLLLVVIVLVTIPLGARLRARASVATFERIVLVLLVGSCISIVADLIAG